jgi:hypothetical protein
MHKAIYLHRCFAVTQWCTVQQREASILSRITTRTTVDNNRKDV